MRVWYEGELGPFDGVRVRLKVKARCWGNVKSEQKCFIAVNLNKTRLILCDSSLDTK